MTGAGDSDDIALTQLVGAGHDLRAAGLVTSHGGNLSTRRGRTGALISTTGSMLGRLGPDTLVPVTADGRLDGVAGPAPSSDTRIHLAIYRTCAEAGAVIHAHPVHAIALAFAEAEIRPINLEGRLFLDRVPVLDVAWEESAEPVAEALVEHPIVMVRGHGSYARGSDVWDALRVTSALEESAQIIMLTRG